MTTMFEREEIRMLRALAGFEDRIFETSTNQVPLTAKGAGDAN